MSKREKVLSTMLEKIAKQGIQGTPMSQIAKDSGVATGTIYHHFKSKEEIINSIYLEKKKDFEQIINHHLEEGLTIKKQFFNLWRGLFQYYVDHPNILKFTLQVAGTPIITKEIREEGRKYYASFFEFIQSGISTGDFMDIEVGMAAELIHANVLKLAEIHLNASLIIEEAKLKKAIQFSWKGLSI